MAPRATAHPLLGHGLRGPQAGLTAGLAEHRRWNSIAPADDELRQKKWKIAAGDCLEGESPAKTAEHSALYAAIVIVKALLRDHATDPWQHKAQLGMRGAEKSRLAWISKCSGCSLPPPRPLSILPASLRRTDHASPPLARERGKC